MSGDDVRCPTCNGTGQAHQGSGDLMPGPITCPTCNGQRYVSAVSGGRCPECGGFTDTHMTTCSLWQYVEPDGSATAELSSTDAESLARRFHEAYERLAPSFGYETREASAVPWDKVPEPNRSLMVAVAADVLRQLDGSATAAPDDCRACGAPQPGGHFGWCQIGWRRDRVPGEATVDEARGALAAAFGLDTSAVSGAAWEPTHRSTADHSGVRLVGLVVENEDGDRWTDPPEAWYPVPRDQTEEDS